MRDCIEYMYMHTAQQQSDTAKFSATLHTTNNITISFTSWMKWLAFYVFIEEPLSASEMLLLLREAEIRYKDKVETLQTIASSSRRSSSVREAEQHHSAAASSAPFLSVSIRRDNVLHTRRRHNRQTPNTRLHCR